MVMLTRKTVVLAKVETTYGSDPTPTAGSNAILALDTEIKEVFSPVERNVNITTMSNVPSKAGIRWAEVNMKVEIKGSGSAGTAPRLGALLRACGFSETVVSNTSVTYNPDSSDLDSVTLYIYKDGRLHIVKGCRGSVKVTCPAGQLGMLEFNFMGIYAAPSNSAIVTGTYDSTEPPRCVSTSFSYNSKTTLVVQQAEIDMNNVVVQRPSLNEATGLKGFEVTGRRPVMVFNPEAQIETSYAFRSDILSTEREVSLQVGSDAGNTLTITVPKFNITAIEYQDREGILIESLTGECAKSAAAGDDEVSLAFT